MEFPLRAWPQKKVLVAVDGVSLRVRQGHSLGVVGESGSGKTTLAMAMVRLIRSRGEIVFDGEPIQVLGFKQLKPLRRSMQIVFQDPYGSLSPRLTVEEIVGEGLGIHEPGLTAGERRRRSPRSSERSASMPGSRVAIRTSSRAVSANGSPSRER